MGSTLGEALVLLGRLDAEVLGVVSLSLRVSGAALLIAVLIGMPLGAALAVGRFPGRDALIVLLNSLMGFPPVVLGVLVYLLLSRSGPLGVLGLLFTPAAMIFAQTLMVIPIIAALARQTLADAWRDYAPEFTALRLTRRQRMQVLLFDCRYSLVLAILAGFGRAISEVGAVMIVGGNIAGYTRVMTTAIALETSRGDLSLSVALGVVLLSLVVAVNAAAHLLRNWAMRVYG